MGPVEAFHYKHGGECVQVNGFWLYKDGAMRDIDPMGVLKEPPDDPYELAKLIVRYHEQLVKRAVERFNERKAEHIAYAELCGRNGWPPPEEKSLSDLKELQLQVNRLNRKLSREQAKLDAVTPPHRRPQGGVSAERRIRAESFASTVRAIRI